MITCYFLSDVIINIKAGMLMEQVVSAASIYRAGHPNLTRGVVLIYHNQAVGWKSSLRNLYDVKPGTLAVDECNRIWEAIGDDGYEGSLTWEVRA